MKKNTCERCGCGIDFEQKSIADVTFIVKFCETCQCKNLLDGLDLPTPPELLDKFTKFPTLTEEQFKKALNEVKVEDETGNEER